MAGTDYSFEGLDALEKQLVDIIDNKFPAEFEALVIQVAYELQGKVKTKSPKATGRLSDGWEVGAIKRVGGDYIIEVYTNVEYAGHVEFGHRKKGGAGFVPGVHMMELSLEEVRRVLPSYLRTWLDDFISTHEL